MKPLQYLLSTFLFVLIAIIQPTAQAGSDANQLELLPISNAGKYGLMSADGKVIIAPTHANPVLVGDNKWPRLLIESKKQINHSSGRPDQSEMDAKYAFVGRDGKLVTDFVYTHVEGLSEGFSEGLALVCKGSGDSMRCGYINEAGKTVIDFRYWASNGFDKQYFNGQLSEVCVRSAGRTRCGLIDRKGNEVVEFKYSGIGEFKDGLVTACSGSGDEKRCGVIEQSGKVVVEIKYSAVYSAEGIIKVCVGLNDARRCGYIDRAGNVIVEPIYSYLGKFEEGRAEVCIGKMYSFSQCGFIDRAGKVITELKFKITNSPEGMARACSGTGAVARCDYIDKSGKFITAPYTIVGKYSEGLIDVCTGSLESKQCGYIDSSGKVVVELNYKKASPFHEDRATVCTMSTAALLCGYIDRSGKIILEPIYGTANMFHNGLAVICNLMPDGTSQCGVVDHDGHMIARPSYDSIAGFVRDASTSVVKRGASFGLLSRTGKLLAQPKYSHIEQLEGGYVELCPREGEAWICGLIDTSGKPITKMKYVELLPLSKDGQVIKACISKHSCSLLDLGGAPTLQTTYDSIEYFHEPNLAKACVKSRKKTLCGMIDRSGKPVIPLIFEDIGFTDNSDVAVGCTQKGKLLSCIYMSLSGAQIGNFGMEFPNDPD